MTSQKFKQQLKQEAKQWHTEGLINQRIYDSLAQRYQFINLTNSSNDRFTAIIITFGCILLGLAVITFVAANWQVWSKPIKVTILIGSFLITNITGFYIWQKATNNWQSRLGQGLLLIGSLILGANIGLMSQMFHQTGEVYELYLIWGFAVLLMAYSLSLTSLGIIAIILIGISYFSSLSWLSARDINYLMELLPLLAICFFVPLAYRCRSPWLFFLTSCLTIVSFNFNCLGNIGTTPAPLRGFLFAIAFAIPTAFFWGYQDKPKLLNFNIAASFNNLTFTNLSRKVAVLYLSIILYIASFNWWWGYPSNSQKNLMSRWQYFALFLEIIVFTIVTIYWWWQLGKRKNTNASWRLDRHSSYIGIAVIIISLLVGLDINYSLVGSVGTIICNGLLFLLALVLINQALKSEKRLGYWSGIILLSLQVLSRMFEYNTGLLTKAIVLFACGLSVIIAGIWFEKNLAQS